MATVMAFGTFDLIHPGHLSYLKQAKDLGNKLIVVVASDDRSFLSKQRKPVYDEEHRLELVKALKFVDEAIVGDRIDNLKIVEELKPDIVALGYDQTPKNEELKKAFEKRGIDSRIARLKPFKETIYKSTKILEKALNNNGEKNI